MRVFIPLIKANSGSDIYFQYLNDALRARNVHVDIKYLPHYLELLPHFRSLLLSTCNLQSYDLVHTNVDYGSQFKISGKPLLATVFHNVFDEGYRGYTSSFQKLYHYGLLNNRMYKALSNADSIIAISRSTKKSVEKTFGFSNIDVIYPGVDTDIFRPKEISIKNEFSGKIKLLFVGNLTKRKGAELLPKIMEKLGDGYLLFYTSGLRTKAIFSQPNMIPLGRLTREKLVEMYNFCDILLLPSRLEGFGYAVAEAMACGKPIVCTNCSSLPELVVDQKSGFLCQQDNIDDFVEKIKILGEKKGLREQMGEFNRQRILENFTIQSMAENYLRVYQSILQSDKISCPKVGA